MILIGAIIGYILVVSVIIVFVSMLSSRMSQHEEWQEEPLSIQDHSVPTVPDYQTDTITSA